LRLSPGGVENPAESIQAFRRLTTAQGIQGFGGARVPIFRVPESTAQDEAILDCGLHSRRKIGFCSG